MYHVVRYWTIYRHDKEVYGDVVDEVEDGNVVHVLEGEGAVDNAGIGDEAQPQAHAHAQ